MMLKCVKMMLTTCWPKRMTANTSPKRKMDIQLKANSLNFSFVAILISLEKKLEMISNFHNIYKYNEIASEENDDNLINI